MNDQSPVGHLTGDVARLALECADSDDADLCERLHLDVGRLERAAREQFQASLRRDFLAIAGKLDEGTALDPTEREALDHLLTGVSRHYVRSEHDVESWRAEIRRIADELGHEAPAGQTDLDALIRIQSLCREARRVVPDLQYYLSERARLARFNASARVIDPEEGRMLAGVIREMMASENR